MQKLTLLPEAAELDVPLIKSIAAAKGKTLTFYDLETTTFLNNPTFGITELAAVHVHPDGTVTQQSSLINPENPISEKAAEITGISQADVEVMSNWGAEARDYLALWAKHNIMIGFNNLSFDNKAVDDQNKRYGLKDTTFLDSRDVRSFWRLMTGTAKGKLTDIASQYGLSPEGAHRAIYDVRMTARVLEHFIKDRGLTFFDHPGSKLDANKKLEKIFMPTEITDDNPHGVINQEHRVLQIIEQCAYTNTKRLSMMTGMSEFNLSGMLGDLIYSDQLDYALVENRDAQAWLRCRLPHIIELAWIGADRGKLKPVFEKIREHMALGTIPNHNGKSSIPTEVDYLQLRVHLKAEGYYAALDKNAAPLPVLKNADSEPAIQDPTTHVTMSL